MTGKFLKFKKMFLIAVFLMAVYCPKIVICQTQPPAAADTVELTSLKHWPRPIKQVPPVYPSLAQQDKVEAEVMLNVLIGKDGKPKNIKVVNVRTSFMKTSSIKSVSSVSDPKYAKLFHKPSVDAVMKWRFTKPLKPDSSTALVWVNVPLKFQLMVQK